MKTIFIKDIEYDSFMIWVMLRGNDPSGVKNRAESMGINEEETLNKIYGVKNYEDIEKFIEAFVKKRYTKDSEKIEEAIALYQKAWDKINDIFYSEVSKITNNNWKFQEYKVVISPFHRGVSNRSNNIILRSAYEDPEDQKRITAHEILMTHIWNVFDKKYSEAKKDEKRLFWALNEITTTAILGLEPSLNKLWSPKTQEYDQYLSNYPQLKKLQMELKAMYLNKKSFSDFLNKALQKIKKNIPKQTLVLFN